ncbi:hypothetical protein WDU94_006033 [Cyamophila willieti]
MPLLVKETSWHQTPAKVFIVVPLNGVPTHKVDMFTSEGYIKLHYGNYIFEKLLLHPINEEASTIRLNNNEAEFELIKVEQAIWDRKKDKRSKEAVSIQMKQETDEQSIVTKLKEEQKWEALSGNYQRDKTDQGNNDQQVGIHGIKNNETNDERKGVIITELTEEDVERIENEEKLTKQRQHKDLMDKITLKVRARIQAEEKQKATPIVRTQGQIGVKFTPRVFPTPMRESMAPEEEEWLKKQAEARQACGFIASDLRPEENNPDWVKAKGDQMFKAGNYLGAVSAYTHGIKLCPKLASLYSNRAAAHIAMNNMFKAVDDAAEVRISILV